MTKRRAWLGRLREWLGRRSDADLEAELRSHLELAADDSTHRAASLRFGDVSHTMETVRGTRRFAAWRDVARDLRYAVRSLRAAPTFTVAAVLTLALGIGANAAVFSLVQAVMLRTLPLTEPDQLHFIAHGSSTPRPDSTSSNYPYFERLRSQSTGVFAGITAATSRRFKVSTDAGIEQVRGQYVSGNYHALLGVRLALGRGFTLEDDRAAGAPPIAVISAAYWTRQFNRRPDILGQTIAVDGTPAAVVGVTTPGFDGLDPGAPVDITLPMSLITRQRPGFLDAHDGWTSLTLVARLKPGVAASQAAATTDAILQQYLREPDNVWALGQTNDTFRAALLLPAGRGTSGLRTQYGTPLGVLMGMVGVLLGIACLNIANLLTVRASTRRKELAVRLSLGATRGRVARQLLTEHALIAAIGGGAGFAFAGWGTRAVVGLLGQGRNGVMLDAQPDAGVLLFTTVVSVVTGLVFGTVPAFRAARVDPLPALKNAVRHHRHARLTGRKLLAAGQVALSLALLVGAGLLVQTLKNVRAIDGGFQRDNLLLFSLDASGTSFQAARLPALCGDLIQRLQLRPEVSSGSCSTMSPVDTRAEFRGLNLPDRPATPEARGVYVNVVGAGYFDTMGIPVRRGRAIGTGDTAAAEKVAVLNDSAAAFFFPGVDPIGLTLSFISRPDTAIRIVGIVGDARHDLRDVPPRMLYTALPQIHEPTSSLTASVRAVDFDRIRRELRAEVRSLSPAVVVTAVRTMEEQIDQEVVRERLLAILSTSFGVVALLLCCVGLYGVMAFDVAARNREIGVRLALGASPASILMSVLRQAALVAALGLTAGLALALSSSESLKGLLFGLPPRDPVTLVGACLMLAVTAAAAVLIPARRAAQIDPVRVLRAD
jgi:predicted permease